MAPFPQTTRGTFHDELTAPLLFLSSEDTGWEGLLVRAYHEPMELQGWQTPVVPDIALILLSSGKMLIEQQRANGSWGGLPLHQGDLMLRPGGSVIREVRWRSLSVEPMQTLQIHLDSDLFARTAEEVGVRDLVAIRTNLRKDEAKRSSICDDICKNKIRISDGERI